MTHPFRILEKYIEPVVIVFALGMIMVLVFADVVARFAFSTSIAPANEAARLAFVYMIYVGVSYAIRERRHMRVTLLLDSVIPSGAISACRLVHSLNRIVALGDSGLAPQADI